MISTIKSFNIQKFQRMSEPLSPNDLPFLIK